MRRRRKELAQPSDIAFLLIIFFLLLVGVDTTRSIDAEMGKGAAQRKETITVTIYDDGSLSQNADRISPSELGTHLTELTSLHLCIEPETSWQHVVDILSLAEQHGVGAISMEQLP